MTAEEHGGVRENKRSVIRGDRCVCTDDEGWFHLRVYPMIEIMRTAR